LLPLTGGCAIVGYAASVIPGAGTKARYPGLQGQKVAIMTWADRGVTYDYPMIQSDVPLSVYNKLRQAADPKLKTPELQGTTFVDPRQAYKFQKNHPEFENRTLAEIAPKAAAALGCTRLIWIEIQPFSLYDPRTPVLLKGMATATIRVAEVNGDQVKVAYEEAGLTVEFPKSAPEGVPPSDTMTPTYVYRGLVDELTTQVAVRFFTTPQE
jgi:hypothetical protein